MIDRDEPAYWFNTAINLNETLDTLVDHAYRDIHKRKIPRKQNKASIKNHLRVILFNLVYAAENHPYNDIVYSRNNQHYKASDQSNPNSVSRKIIDLIDDLEKAGYIKNNRKGFQDRSNKKQSYMARMQAGAKILDHISSSGFEYTESAHAKSTKPYQEIILRDADGNDINFEETTETERMQNNIQFFNDKLSAYEIELLADEDRQSLLQSKFKSSHKRYKEAAFEELPFFDTSRVKLHRVFNQSSFDLGGRFYGHWVQSIYAKDYTFRQHLTINGEPSIELDFSGLHPYMCYQLAGEQPPKGDMYEIPIEDYARNRPTVKKVLNAMLNTTGKSFKEARNKVISSVTKEITGWYSDDLGTRELLSEIVEKLLEKHEEIREAFFTGAVKKCQRLDSDVIELVMLDLMARDIPVIPIHDSLITQKRFESELREAMQKAYQKVMGNEPPPIKISREKIFDSTDLEDHAKAFALIMGE